MLLRAIFTAGKEYFDMGFLNNRYCTADRFWKAVPQRVKCRAKAREFVCCEQLEHFQ